MHTTWRGTLVVTSVMLAACDATVMEPTFERVDARGAALIGEVSPTGYDCHWHDDPLPDDPEDPPVYVTGWECHYVPEYSPPLSGGGSNGPGGGGGGGGGSCPDVNCDDPPMQEDWVTPPAGVPEDLYSRLTREEKRLCWNNPTHCISVNSARMLAEDFAFAVAQADQFFGPLADNKYDALRHAYWNAVMTRVIGRDRAEAWATAHESEESPTNPSVCMDLSNNAIGRDVGASMTGSTYPEMQNVLLGMANANPPQLKLSPGCGS